MRRSVLIAVVAAFALMGANTGMTFSLSTQEKEYRAGAPIPFTWKLTNGTDRTWLVYRELIPAGYDQISLQIEGPSGKRTLRLGNVEVAASIVSACWLPPGRTLEGRFELSTTAELFHYPMPPGLYRITGTFDHALARRQGALEGRTAGTCGEKTIQQKPATVQDILDATLVSPQITFAIK
jgi:hypothetical protein